MPKYHQIFRSGQKNCDFYLKNPDLRTKTGDIKKINIKKIQKIKSFQPKNHDFFDFFLQSLFYQVLNMSKAFVRKNQKNLDLNH